MKPQLKKWIRRFVATAVLIAILLFVIILNPVLTYASKTVHNNFSIYHSKSLNAAFLANIDDAAGLLKTSEFYNPGLKLDICLNDGSVYPKLIRLLRGPAFAWGFYNKVVLQGTANYQGNYAELNGYKWNLTQLLAHEMTHCLQFHKLGFWKSNPVANIPGWKWEGYAEYISRQGEDQKDLLKNISILQKTDKEDWAVILSDSTISPKQYFDHLILVQYCMDIKKMTYQQVLKDTAGEESVRTEMMGWYEQKTNRK